MNSFRAKLVTSIIAYGCIIGALVGGVLYYALPSYYGNWYWLILAFFLVVEPLLIVFVDYSSKDATSRGLVNLYMMTKVIKTILFLAAVSVGYFIIKENFKSFALTFMILYMLFLAVETILFARIEKRLKEKKQ